MTAEIPIRPSVHGLKRECLSYGEVLAQSFAVLAPTTVPAAVMGLIFASSGNGTWLSFLLGMIGLVFVGVNINQFARRSASPGSLYSYVVKGLGPTAGVLSGWGLILAYLFTGMSTLCGFAIFGQKLLDYVGIQTHILTLFAVGVAAAWYAAHKDIQLSAKVMLLLEGASISSILLLGVLIWGHHGFAIDPAQLTLQNATPGGITAGIVLVVFGFSGFESSTSLGDEAKDPLKSIPKSVMQSTILAGLFFIFMAYVEVLGFQGVSADLAKTEAPLDFLAHQAGVDFLGIIISLGALLSFFTCTLGCINPTARVMFLMARHGVFHTSLGASHEENMTPHTSIALASLLTFVIPTAVVLFGVSPFDSQGYFGTICTYGFLLVYILISIAAPVYLHRLGELRPVNVVFSVLGVGFMALPLIGTIGIPGSDLFPAPEAPANVFPYLFALYIAAGFSWFVFQRYRSPRLVRQMQRSIEAIHAQHANPNRVDES
ncbi:APC family permease [Leptolyngbya sp. NIES-2104]|uniref:APC family permease n=1 Tax=Leptolyngbya sp. NIES-2104 TaxID=1552121 RepID=UPI0006EC6267|nr:APC family permease [Leptolyngbya sp. NIES-2104]GAP94169.1 amino acid permease-associated region [Leptolyngbya sp. NIES-2104]